MVEIVVPGDGIIFSADSPEAHNQIHYASFRFINYFIKNFKV